MSLRFYCNQCPASFNQFEKLVRHYEAKHNPDSEQYRKLRDAITYSGADSGCKVATEYLGRQSSCLDCPFKRKCVYDTGRIGIANIRKRRRDGEIIRRWKQGERIKDLAVEFGVTIRTIQRVVK